MSKYQENLSPSDLFLELEAFSEGRSTRAWKCFGAHPAKDENGTEGYLFRVWAPNAPKVTVIGDFNGWDLEATPMAQVEGGIWEAFVPGLQRYDAYQYAIHKADGSNFVGKADPYAFHAATRPDVSSKLYDLETGYQWGDQDWLDFRAKNPPYRRPMNIYECHLGSWRRTGEGEFLSYRELTSYLVPYVKEMGFTHVELLPVTEHPLDASWGYQCTGYFAATSRFGVPDDLKYLVDQLHQAGVGVIMDWVPAHFPRDAFGLYNFDGTPTYEYQDPRKGEHADWGTNVFDLGRNEVRSFLFSSAMFWLEEYHMDGLRVDAVSSMLYLDYGRQDGAWMPNVNGGNENLEAIKFFQDLNTAIFGAHPDVLMVAEESTAWPKVTKPVDDGGLGFNFKWNMGWMNDICHYIKLDPYFRQFNHRDITFSLMYAFSENYILPLSHDEVVHMKGSVRGKMPGDEWQQLAGVRGFYAYTMAHPGKKLSFMGMELGTEQEWHYEDQLDWAILEKEGNRQLHQYIKDINHFYLKESPLWEDDYSWEGFQWLVPDDNQNNVVVFLRRNKAGEELVCAVNFNPNTYEDYRFGCPPVKEYVEVFNSDEAKYGGTGAVNAAPCKVEWIPSHGQESSVSIRIPPFGAVFLKGRGTLPAKEEEVPADEVKPVKRTRKTAAKKAGEEAPAVEAKPVKRTRKAAAKAAAEEAPAVTETPKKPGRKPAVKKAAAAEKKSAPRGRKKTPSTAE